MCQKIVVSSDAYRQEELQMEVLKQYLSEFAFFQKENKAITRSMLILLLYNAFGTVNLVWEGAAADGRDTG